MVKEDSNDGEKAQKWCCRVLHTYASSPSLHVHIVRDLTHNSSVGLYHPISKTKVEAWPRGTSSRAFDQMVWPARQWDDLENPYRLGDRWLGAHFIRHSDEFRYSQYSVHPSTANAGGHTVAGFVRSLSWNQTYHRPHQFCAHAYSMRGHNDSRSPMHRTLLSPPSSAFRLAKTVYWAEQLTGHFDQVFILKPCNFVTLNMDHLKFWLFWLRNRLFAVNFSSSSSWFLRHFRQWHTFRD